MPPPPGTLPPSRVSLPEEHLPGGQKVLALEWAPSKRTQEYVAASGLLWAGARQAVAGPPPRPGLGTARPLGRSRLGDCPLSCFAVMPPPPPSLPAQMGSRLFQKAGEEAAATVVEPHRAWRGGAKNCHSPDVLPLVQVQPAPRDTSMCPLTHQARRCPAFPPASQPAPLGDPSEAAGGCHPGLHVRGLSLTTVHAEVALRADGLDEAVRPAAKGMPVSWGRLPSVSPFVKQGRGKPEPEPHPAPTPHGPTTALHPHAGHTHMLVYMRWPFCWFCSLVLARSMGKTQVTPISPAMPPLMSLAGRLCGKREGQDRPPRPQVSEQGEEGMAAL